MTVPDPAHEVPSGPLLLFSPHLDDAALSCAALLDRPEPVDVVTVFAGEPDPPREGWWDKHCGFGSSAESLPVRKREDEAAFAGSGHRLRSLPFYELQYLDGPRAETERAAVRELVADWARSRGEGTVAVPAGAGRKLVRGVWRLAALAPGRFGFVQADDHIFVREAVLAVLKGSKTLTGLLYEELPYLWTRPADREVAAAAANWGFSAHPVTLPVDRRAKARRIAAYSSQVPHLTAGSRKPDRPESLPELERYWRVEWAQW